MKKWTRYEIRMDYCRQGANGCACLSILMLMMSFLSASGGLYGLAMLCGAVSAMSIACCIFCGIAESYFKERMEECEKNDE